MFSSWFSSKKFIQPLVFLNNEFPKKIKNYCSNPKITPGQCLKYLNKILQLNGGTDEYY